MKKIVFAFGRMNPPTTGHHKLVTKVKSLAQKEKADHLIIASHTHDPKRNPLTPEQKEKHISRFFPKTNIRMSNKQNPSFISQLKKMNDDGYKHVTLVAGEDRVKEFQSVIDRYNGKEFHFHSAKVVSAGKRDPDSESVTGMSATKMRHHAVNNNFEEFKKGVPKHVSDEHAKELFKDIRGGMKVDAPVKSMDRFVTRKKKSLPVLENIENLPDFIIEGINDPATHKVIFMSGSPGAGKTFIANQVAPNALGFRHINLDNDFEHELKKAKLSTDSRNVPRDRWDSLRDKAKRMTSDRKRMALHGRNGIVLDGTGKDPEKIAEVKRKMESIGYETKLVHVHTSKETSLKRNAERPRKIPEDDLTKTWHMVNNNKEKTKQLFGNDYHEIHNENDMNDPQLKSGIQNTYKAIMKWSKTPSQHPAAKAWRDSNTKNINKKK